MKKGISLSRAIEFACISGGFFATAEIAMRYEQNFAIGALLFFVCLVLLTIYTTAEVIKSRREARWLIVGLQAVCIAAVFIAIIWWILEPWHIGTRYKEIDISRFEMPPVAGNGESVGPSQPVMVRSGFMEHGWYSLVLAGAAIAALLLVTITDSATRGKREDKSGE